MILSNAAVIILRQLSNLLNQMKPSDYARASVTLGGTSIGQHVRHTLEFFNCFEAGYKNGVINYDNRRRDHFIETDKTLALEAIEKAITFIVGHPEEKDLQLDVGYDKTREEYISIGTNSLRELVYNIEHAVHHMAIIKIGVGEVAPYVVLEHDFGIAASTVRHARIGLLAADLKGDSLHELGENQAM